MGRSGKQLVDVEDPRTVLGPLVGATHDGGSQPLWVGLSPQNRRAQGG